MAQQAPGRRTRELRREYGRLFDQAADLIASSRSCDCGAERHGANLDDLSTMINDMLLTRQQVGACHSLPPCDGTNPEDDLSDEALNSILARLESNCNVIHGEVEASPCDCADRPNIPEPQTPERISDEERERRRLQELYGTPTPPRNTSGTPVPVDPTTLMTLPAEIRNMVWWRALRPNNGIVRIVPHRLDQPPFNQQLYSQSRLGGPVDHLERFSVQGYNLFGRLNRETWALLGERHGGGGWPAGTIDNDFNILRTNPAIYWEGAEEFWRRAAADGLMFSFGPEVHSQDPPGPVGHVEYDGILSAYTFFITLLRDDPTNPASLVVDPNNPTGPMVLPDSLRFTQNMHGIDYLRQIRRIHIDLTNTTRGTDRQALAPYRQPGRTNSVQYLDALLDMLYINCTGLEHLSLAFVGWVPDLTLRPWGEGPDRAVFNPPGLVTHPSSMHWYSRLTQFSRRPLLRLRLRVTFSTGPFGPMLIQNPMQNLPVWRARRFICTLRRHMLINGQALGGNYYRVQFDDTGPPTGPRFTVEIDDSWDPVTQTHSQHDWDQTDESDYNPP